MAAVYQSHPNNTEESLAVVKPLGIDKEQEKASSGINVLPGGRKNCRQTVLTTAPNSFLHVLIILAHVSYVCVHTCLQVCF